VSTLAQDFRTSRHRRPGRRAGERAPAAPGRAAGAAAPPGQLARAPRLVGPPRPLPGGGARGAAGRHLLEGRRGRRARGQAAVAPSGGRCRLFSADIPQIGSVGARKAATSLTFGQLKCASRGGSRAQGAARPRPAGEAGPLRCGGRSRHMVLPSTPAAAMVRSCQATATGGPRKRSIRRRIVAKSARGTATSASWNTT
jgi:hypothetical protein